MGPFHAGGEPPRTAAQAPLREAVPQQAHLGEPPEASEGCVKGFSWKI